MDLEKKPVVSDIDNEWEIALENRRSVRKEARILYHALLGHYTEYKAFNASQGKVLEENVLDFWDSKRPYGNKDIPASIAFTLGWGNDALLQEELPGFVEDAALELHDEVKALLIKEYLPLEKELNKLTAPQPIIKQTKVVKRSFVADIRDWYEGSIFEPFGMMIGIMVILIIFTWLTNFL